MSSVPELHHGYYSGSGYTFNVYPEYFPLRLRLISLLRSHRAPLLEGPFRLIEFGCGQGVGLAVMAAVHPQAHFHGLDLLPAHISHAKALVAAAGLSNVSFEEADFLQLISPSQDAEPSPPCGTYDIAIAHGVLSWVSREVQQALWQLAASSLRPGGLFALSYNAFPGQLSQVPFQHLVRSLQDYLPAGQPALAAAVDLSHRLQQSGAAVFAAQPGLKGTSKNQQYT